MLINNNYSIEMPLHESSKIYGIIPKEIKDNYDVVEIIKCIVDKSEFLEYKKFKSF